MEKQVTSTPNTWNFGEGGGGTVYQHLHYRWSVIQVTSTPQIPWKTGNKYPQPIPDIEGTGYLYIPF